MPASKVTGCVIVEDRAADWEAAAAAVAAAAAPAWCVCSCGAEWPKLQAVTAYGPDEAVTGAD